MAEIIDGKKLASEVLDEVRAHVEVLTRKGIVPNLAGIIVGDDPASHTYVRNKRRDAEKCGMQSVLHAMPPRTEADDLEELIDALNADPTVHGILLQLPLPDHLDEAQFVARIDPSKDVDGLTPVNAGLLAQGTPRFVPCTPSGVQQMLLRSGVQIEGAHVVVVGRSNLVGRPLSVLLSLKAEGGNATVTVCHTRTRDLASMTREADILVVAAGAPKAIGAEHVSPGAVVIDVGINVGPDGKLTGDVDFDAVAPIARAISPVPGGVGPMTRAMLMVNTATAAEAALPSVR